jgi:RNA polymerase sigma factor (sigma-70 family)
LKDPIREVTPKLLRDLACEARERFPTLAEYAEDIVQEAFIKTAKATWDWCPSKAYLKRAVHDAGVDLIRYREEHEREIPVDFQKLDAWVEPNEQAILEAEYIYPEDDVWDPPTKWADTLAPSEPPKRRRLSPRDRAVLRALREYSGDPEVFMIARENRVEWEATTGEIWDAFSERDREFLLDYFIEGFSLRRLAAKYGLSKSTVERRLKDLAKAIPGKEDVVSKPSRQKKKTKRKKVSGTRRVMVTKPLPIEPLSA